MWSEAKQKTGFGGLLVCIRGTTRLSANWMRWQIVRGKRRLLWETNTDILSRWAQSVIETEILLREVTQHESFVKECIQIVNANHDPVVKAILPDMVEELITLDHEYDRLERTYETIVAGCPAGPIKSGYLTVSIAVAAVAARADAARHLRTLVEGKGGVIARPSVLVVKVCVGSERAKEGSDFCSRPMI
ncbi:hypothetical protein MYU51_003795 [Penicillium brevicompactum]